MKRRLSSRDAVTIQDELVYQEAVGEMLDAFEEFSKHHGAGAGDERATAYRMCEAAANNSWNALTAVIDAYVARRISETLEKL